MRIPCRRSILENGPLVMGILNVTPDSFSDGGSWTKIGDAVRHAFDMVDQGAAVIDIGAESTRPGSVPVSQEDELERLIPVLDALLPSISVPVSIDTMKPAVAEKCLSMGADIVNDVNGLRSSGMAEVCSDYGAAVVIGHMHGDIQSTHSMSMGADYKEKIVAFLKGRCEAATDAGIDGDRIIIDPGIGFGKTMEQNLEIATDPSFLGKDHPILIGASRKRFLREFYPEMDIDDATAMVSKRSVGNGADIVRVHDVARMVTSLQS